MIEHGQLVGEFETNDDFLEGQVSNRARPAGRITVVANARESLTTWMKRALLAEWIMVAAKGPG